MPLSRRNVLFGITALPASALLGRRPLPGLSLTVCNGYELRSALQAAGAGSSIVLAPGNYGDVGGFSLASSGVSLRVQSPLRTVLRAPLEVHGDRVDLDGIAFEEHVHLAGAGLTITNSQLNGGLNISGIDVEVAYCEIGGHVGRGIAIGSTARNCHVHHNYLHDQISAGDDGNATILVGGSMRSTDTPVNALIEYNLLERCKGGNETLGVKSSGNTIRFNTAVECKNFTNRHGENNTWAANTFINSYTITIHDQNNQVLGNKFVHSKGIRVMGGDHAWNGNVQGGHPQAYNTFVCGNDGTLQIGVQWGKDALPALGTTVAAHKGKIRLLAHLDTNLAGVPVPVPDPVPLDRSSVGPRSPAPGPGPAPGPTPGPGPSPVPGPTPAPLKPGRRRGTAQA